MKEKFKLLISDQFIRISLMLSLLFIIPLIVIIIVFYNALPPFIPFFNSMPWGEQRLSGSEITIFLPLLLVSILLINILIATSVYKKFVLISRIILFNCFLFLFLGLLAYLQILFLAY